MRKTLLLYVCIYQGLKHRPGTHVRKNKKVIGQARLSGLYLGILSAFLLVQLPNRPKSNLDLRSCAALIGYSRGKASETKREKERRKEVGRKDEYEEDGKGEESQCRHAVGDAIGSLMARTSSFSRMGFRKISRVPSKCRKIRGYKLVSCIFCLCR